MSTQRKPTKEGSLTTAFIQAAARNPEGALSSLLLAAFGISLSTIMAVCERMLTGRDASIIIMCLTAGVQIRNHVVFVGREYANVRVQFPEFIIEGNREQRDIFNFGALHACGHALAHITGNPLGSKIVQKAGSCITGEYLTDTDAGKINREIFNSWTTEDKAGWAPWATLARATHGAVLDPVVASIPARARDFTATLAAPPVPVLRAPARAPAAAAGGAAPAAPP